ncbi:hypothetical protein AB9P05_13030 [Roseivirga sp. BDSF3-8]|uniref:hypothetical protein n=1 Tax=Roseivirga sp. BDSF3-8 TaxID=3241598 RepID=UPI003532650C
MDNLSIETIWKSNSRSAVSLPGVAETAEAYRNRSGNVVDRIMRTARREHRLFLAVAAIGIAVALGTTYYLTAAGIALFTGLIIWKYVAEMRMMKRIRIQGSTCDYLMRVRRLLQWFMKVYRIGFGLLTPVSVLGGIALGAYKSGASLSTTFTDPVVLGVAGLAAVGGILVSRLWLRLWVQTFYGKKLQEMDRLIAELRAEEG